MDWKKAPLVALLLVPVAVAAQLPDPGEEQEVWRLIQACDTNNNGRLTCDEVKACNNGSRLTVTKSERPALYHLMVDGDDDGQVCEGGPDPDPTGQVVFGLGMATGLKDHSLAENGVRPVLLASYLIRRKPEKKIRPGLMAVLDSELPKRQRGREDERFRSRADCHVSRRQHRQRVGTGVRDRSRLYVGGGQGGLRPP